MKNNEILFQLTVGEFLALYLRFYYETQKFGELSKRLILGKGLPTLFGEKTEKLVRSLAYSFGQDLELQRLIFHQYLRDFGYIIENVRRRFEVLDCLMNGEKPEGENVPELFSECFRVCELIGKAGEYYLLCLSVRNRDNPRELIQIELYFDVQDKYSIDLNSLFNLLNKQAENARVLIEGYQYFWIKLPDLAGLLETAGVTFDRFIENLPLVGKWWFSSIQHVVNDHQKKDTLDNKENSESKEKQEADDSEWIKLYQKGELKIAEEYLVKKITETRERNERARLYNDLGYIRSNPKIGNENLGRKDLETAFDLHYHEISLTLLNLSYLDILNSDYNLAIGKIENALLLSLVPSEIEVSFLRILLPDYKLGFIKKCEQHPANIIEAAYINLAFATLNLDPHNKIKDAILILEEGLELFPNSFQLKRALARHFLNNQDFRSAKSIYSELVEDLQEISDDSICYEVNYFNSIMKRRIKKSNKKRRNK